MQFNLYATFRVLAGVKTIQIDLPQGATIRQAVDAVIAERPVLRQHWLDATGDLHVHVHIFVDGQDVQTLPLGLETPLSTTSVLDFFPPVGGGLID